MRRLARLLSVPLALACAPASCTRTADPPREGARPPSPSPTPVADAPLLPGATCRFPSRLDHDVVLARGCVADVLRSTYVESGHVLTLEPGVTLRFASGTFLELGHRGSRLVARGTAEAPIVLTSAATDKRPGDWVGLVIGDSVSAPGATLEHVVLEYAGSAAHGGRGAITVFAPFEAGRVSIRDSTIRRSAQRAIDDPHVEARFGAFERNLITENERGIRVAPQTYASLGEGNVFDDEVELLGGVVDRGGRFAATRGRIKVDAPIEVQGADALAELVVAPGTTLAFAPGAWLEIGTRGPASIVADGVVLTSGALTPSRGNWVGVIIGDQAQRSRISRTTIDYAGQPEHGGDGAITFVGARTWLGLDVALWSIAFHEIQQSHVSTNGEGCDKALDPRAAFSWEFGVDFCH
jgi:hypothetical protein